jgi:hypothetical protein
MSSGAKEVRRRKKGLRVQTFSYLVIPSMLARTGRPASEFCQGPARCSPRRFVRDPLLGRPKKDSSTPLEEDASSTQKMIGSGNGNIERLRRQMNSTWVK